MSRRQALRCAALRTDGVTPCGNYAMNGTTVCHAHGGRAGQVRLAAKRRIVERKATAALARIDAVKPLADPVGELLNVVGEIVELKNVLRDHASRLRRIARTDRQGREEVRATLAAYERSLERTAKTLTDLAKLDLQARKQRLDEAMDAEFYNQIEAAMVGALEDAGLTADVRQLVLGRFAQRITEASQAGAA